MLARCRPPVRMPGRIRSLAARSRVGHVRLGLRLTLWQNANKPAGSQTEDQPAASQDDDQPTASHAPWTEEQPAGSRTESFPAVSAGGDLPAISHEEYLPAGNRTGDGGTGEVFQTVQLESGDQPAASDMEEHAVESEQAVETEAAGQYGT